MLVLAALAAQALFGLGALASWLLALALLTPSAGFILDSLTIFGLTPRAEFLTKTKAIAAEILALGTLFVALQSSSAKRLALSTLALLVLIYLIPLLFRLFAVRIAPFAPRSEFAFLLMLAVLCAHATQRLGVYYLVGAFLVGVAAQQFRERLPAMSSEKMLHAVEAFASLFAPFYFFHAGLHVRLQDLGLRGVAVGLGLLLVCVPLRVGQVALHQRWLIGEPWRRGFRVGVALLPTLVFSLVIAEILRERGAIPGHLFTGLILYTLVNTTLPGLFLRTPPPEWDAPHLLDPGGAEINPSR
jgi:Kef-type K+ transport system membrane component KefB